MFRPSKFALFLIVIATTIAGACGDDDPVTPTEPDPVAQTKTFERQLNPNGGRTDSFAVERAGDILAVLTRVEPDSIEIGLSLGTYNTLTGVCQVILANDRAKQGTIIRGTASTSGEFCVRVYDVGNLTGTINYQVDVQHF